MTENDSYFVSLFNAGRIEVDAASGKVYSIVGKRRRVVGARQSAGYLHMSAGPTRQERHYMLLHRLVWLTVHGDIPDGYEVNHKNGDKHDNRIDNLELKTRSGNVIHAHKVLGKTFGIYGRDNSGENSSRAKLNWKKVRTIRRLYATGRYTQQQLADTYGVGHSNISAIIRHANWHEVKEPRTAYTA